MSVRVVARIRPLLKTERNCDNIVSCTSPASPVKSIRSTKAKDTGGALKTIKPKQVDESKNTVVKIPNPKNEAEEFSFKFHAVYGEDASQQELFDAEVAPTVKHLFGGHDITLFAYGVTGTGKTHTMRGGRALADRGVIPRLLSGIFRRCRKIERDLEGQTQVGVAMSYYEIYNDKVFDLFEPVERRTPSGLPLRDNGGKTVVVGLTERPCSSLKEFESMYDQANMNRSTSATKLNSHSSRSHAILSVKLTMTTEERTRVSTASCIDLAGSEDNRRTDNGKERMVESASINKSLFVLAQCVDAINKKQARIPYRESKMTRILSLGQNNGLTVMILNLAPVRSYHLDTLSSLNFANRTKKIETRDIENEPMFKGPPRLVAGVLSSSIAPSMKRQPLRPLASSINVNLGVTTNTEGGKPSDGKPVKTFAVYTDGMQPKQSSKVDTTDVPNRRPSLKRRFENTVQFPPRSAKIARLAHNEHSQSMESITAAKFEALVEKKVKEVLAARVSDELESQRKSHHDTYLAQNEQVQRRLELLEKRIDGTEDERAEGLSYLLMAKQHQARGENSSALKMFQLAQPHFPNNSKLASKIESLKTSTVGYTGSSGVDMDDKDEQYEDREEERTSARENMLGHPKEQKKASRPKRATHHGTREMAVYEDMTSHSPRTTHILSVINTRDVSQIKLLRGVGVKKAEAIVDCLCELDNGSMDRQVQLESLAELEKMRGVGSRTVENMRNGIEA
ncbi:hypothetical protein FQN57_001459 [Myotisia sp. PD_48]|nr:hypothetical protein FQN57_001459 [Myotisia sp. PD_48]